MNDSSTAQPNCKSYYSAFNNGVYFSLKIMFVDKSANLLLKKNVL